MDILASVIKAVFGSQGRKRPQTDPALRREDQGCLPLNRGPLERRAARPQPGAQTTDRRLHRRGRSPHRRAESTARTARDVARGEGEDLEGDRRDDQAHRRQDRGQARRNPARGLRHHEGHGAPLRAERHDRSDGQRLRPRAGRNERLRHHRGRQGRVRQSLDGRRQRHEVGHDPLRLPAPSAAWC